MAVKPENLHAPITPKQLWRIRRDAAVKDVGQLPGQWQVKLENPELLTCGAASDLIELMLRLPSLGGAEQLPDGSFVREDEEGYPEEGVYAVTPWDCPGVLVRVNRSRRSGRLMANRLKLDWKTGAHTDSWFTSVKTLLEGESELGPIRSIKPLPLEEVVAFADLSGWCVVCSRRASDLGCTHTA